MKNKLIILIMAVPILMVFVVFGLTSYVSLKTEVSVSGVNILLDEYNYIDLASTNTLKIENEIIPANATNKNVSYSYEKLKSNENVTCNISENGEVTFNGIGSVRIIVKTIDGNYQDSITVNVGSSKMIDFNILTPNSNINVGDRINFNISTIPANMTYDSITWLSKNEDILSINSSNGVAVIKDSGEVEISAKIIADGKEFNKSALIVIQPLNTDSKATIMGQKDATLKLTENNLKFKAIVYLNEFENVNSIEDFSFEYEAISFSSFNVDKKLNSEKNILELTVNAVMYDDYFGQTKISLNYLNTEIASYSLNRVEFIAKEDCSFVDLNNYVKRIETNSITVGDFSIDHISSDPNYIFKARTSNSEILEVGNKSDSSLSMFYRAKKDGKVIIFIDCYYKTDKKFTLEKEVEVVSLYSSIRFLESNKFKWRVDDCWALGSQNIVNGEILEEDYKLNLYSGNTPITKIDLLNFEVSNPSIAEMINGKLKIKKNGKVNIRVTNKNNNLVQDDLEENIAIECVLGVNVYNYSDLVIATESEKQVVVQDNIMLGQKLIEKTSAETKFVEGMNETKAKNILNSEVKQIETTADWTYYKNIANLNKRELAEIPTVNYCIEFKNNVFGNGYYLNAEYITNLVDITNKPLSWSKFNGPLDMVALMNVASVKAQDNISFLIRKDNITVKNIELKSCDNVNDLTKLNYVGTTLEIMGDNTNLYACNVQNGRNVVRIFGGKDPDKKINVNIEKCALRYAREFILKMGTNKHILGTVDTEGDPFANSCPSLENFIARNDNNLNNQYFVDNYVKTVVNLKDSMFAYSGIFSIGIETKFAGPCLAGYPYNNMYLSKEGWYDLAGTSYPCILNIIGDVRLYDWKKLSNIDSSTLIETISIDSFNLSFDIKKIISNASKISEYQNLISDYNNEKYVHGGITMYGGGKNYSIINLKNYTGSAFDNYEIGFDVLEDENQKSILQMAAGKEPFRFKIYDSNNFSIQKQIDDLNNGDAFKFMN